MDPPEKGKQKKVQIQEQSPLIDSGKLFSSTDDDPHLDDAIDMDRGSVGSSSLASRDDDWIQQDYFGASDITEKMLDEQKAKKYLEEQDKPKPVSRILPVFIDVIILLNEGPMSIGSETIRTNTTPACVTAVSF